MPIDEVGPDCDITTPTLIWAWAIAGANNAAEAAATMAIRRICIGCSPRSLRRRRACYSSSLKERGLEGQGSALDPPGARRPWTGIPEGEAGARGGGGSGGGRAKNLTPRRHRPPHPL